MLRVFISHSSKDRDEVHELYQRLGKDGYSPWLDQENLLPGQDWQLGIRKALRDAHVVLICLSPTAVNRSGYFQKEIRLALDIADRQPEDSIFIIPIRLKDCKVPESLKVWHWLDIFGDDSYERLRASLDIRAEFLEIPPGLGTANDPPEKPSAAKGDRSIPPGVNEVELRSPDEGDTNTGGGSKGSRLGAETDDTEIAKPAGRTVAGRQVRGRSLEGEYAVIGVNEDGSRYRGTATIRELQELVFIVSHIAKNTHICKGQLSGRSLVVGGDFRVSYRVDDDGSLEGTWGENGTCVETLTRIEHSSSKGGLGGLEV